MSAQRPPKDISREDILNLIGGEAPREYIADHFGKYALPVFLGRFLARYELFKKVIGVSGSIVECGLRSGDGIFQWFELSRMLEPLNRRRVIYGFDTFEGFPAVSEKDGRIAKVGDQAEPIFEDVLRCLAMHEQNYIMMQHDQTNWLSPTRFAKFSPWGQMMVTKGDFMQTADLFMKEYPHIVIALLYLDFDLYEPTKKAIELFLPRMPKGAVIAFDEIDHPDWPGETLALLDTIGIRNLAIERLPWMPTLGFAVLS